jgi:kynurenine formamidase
LAAESGRKVRRATGKMYPDEGSNTRKVGMRMKMTTMLAAALLAACAEKDEAVSTGFQYAEVIDLGAVITGDIAQKVAGSAFLAANGIDRLNKFEVVAWTANIGGGSVSGSNAFYTLASHGGPHVDAPNHVGLDGGIDSYPINSFVGPLKVFDVSEYPKGFTVPIDVFTEQSIEPGDVVLIYTNYAPPMDEESYPQTVTITRDAAEYLAEIPIRAFGTDAYSIANLQQQAVVESTDPTARVVPIHHSFLSRGIPVYEQLFDVERLIDKERMFFVGVPVNIPDGDGMIVRPVVFAF